MKLRIIPMEAYDVCIPMTIVTKDNLLCYVFT